MVRYFSIFLLTAGTFLFSGEVSSAAQFDPVKILIVPGHDRQSPGAIYGKVKEMDMNQALADKILELLKQDPNFDVHITRDSGGYTKEFQDYFSNNKESIDIFTESSKANMLSNVASGLFTKKENTPHGLASEDTAFRLYGFNKWVNTNDVDVVLHVHFNDHKRKNRWVKGNRKGFAIYVPDEELVNSGASRGLAESIFEQLKTKYSVSDYYKEMAGVVPDQKLIATGANHTLISSVASILVEYSYIYEFTTDIARQNAYENMSQLTVQGIRDYFETN